MQYIYYRMLNNFLLMLEYSKEQEIYFSDHDDNCVFLIKKYCMYIFIGILKIVKIFNYSTKENCNFFCLNRKKYYSGYSYNIFNEYNGLEFMYMDKDLAIYRAGIYINNELRKYNTYGTLYAMKKKYDNRCIISYHYNIYITSDILFDHFEININSVFYKYIISNYCFENETHCLYFERHSNNHISDINHIVFEQYIFNYTINGNISSFEYLYNNINFIVFFKYDDILNVKDIKIFNKNIKHKQTEVCEKNTFYTGIYINDIAYKYNKCIFDNMLLIKN